MDVHSILSSDILQLNKYLKPGLDSYISSQNNIRTYSYILCYFIYLLF